MITIEAVAKIAKLAKLHFSAEETDHFAQELNCIMDMINKLNELDCSNVEPLTSVVNMNSRMRQDIAEKTDISDKIFTNVPETNANFAKEIKYFIVPKTVE